MRKQTLIKNPLTVIAIFASLTEIVCGTVTPFITDLDNQRIFLIFVIVFPLILILLFFATLNFNHKVLYSPSDFGESNEKIAGLFYGKEAGKEILEKSSETIKINNFLKDIVISELSPETKPFYVFAKDFYDSINKLLPDDKIEEINFDSSNKVIHSLEIRIKPQYLKESEKARDVFVLYIDHSKEYDNETNEYSEEAKTTGLIAGSGIKRTPNADELGFFVIKTINDRIK